MSFVVLFGTFLIVRDFPDVLDVQDKFDHDKGQKSAISGRRLHWRLSTGFFCFFSRSSVQFSKTSPLKSGESSEKSSGENRVKSCHVCGCHGFFGPEMFPLGPFLQGTVPTPDRVRDTISLSDKKGKPPGLDTPPPVYLLSTKV